MEDSRRITGEVAFKHCVDGVFYVRMREGSDKQETAVKMMVDPAQLQHLPALDFHMRQLATGSRWTFVGHMTMTKKRRLPLLVVQSMQLLKISDNTQTIRALLEAGEANTVSHTLLARVLYPHLEEEDAVAKFATTLEEYVKSEQKGRFVGNLLRLLLLGVPRKCSQRPTRVAFRLVELINSDQSNAVRCRWPVQQYEADAVHDEIAATVKVDHLDHVDCATLEERVEYLATKKRPQVAAMIKTIRELVHSVSEDPYDDEIIFIDVGGGRGDLTLAIVERFPHCKMVMVDINGPALQSARAEAAERGLEDRIIFLNVAWKKPVPAEVMQAVHTIQQQRKSTASRELPVILVGLHACGGLSDTLLQACATHQWSFCCCPCCFASNKKLRTWRTKGAAASEGQWMLVNLLLNELGSLAESPRTPYQRDAMHLVNSIRCELCALTANNDEVIESTRLAALLTLAVQLDVITGPPTNTVADGGEHVSAETECGWDMRILEFPQQWSGRNMILAGRAPLR